MKAPFMMPWEFLRHPAERRFKGQENCGNRWPKTQDPDKCKRDRWGGERVVGGVLPRINIGTDMPGVCERWCSSTLHIGWGLCDRLCLILVCRGRYGLGGVTCVCMLQGRHIAHKFESGWEVGVIKTFDKKGPHAGKFSVKYKDDPNWWTHSLLPEGYGNNPQVISIWYTLPRIPNGTKNHHRTTRVMVEASSHVLLFSFPGGGVPRDGYMAVGSILFLQEQIKDIIIFTGAGCWCGSESVVINKIESISIRRHLLVEAIRVETSVRAAGKAAAEEMAGKLTGDRIQRELSKGGLPTATVLEAAKPTLISAAAIEVDQNQPALNSSIPSPEPVVSSSSFVSIPVLVGRYSRDRVYSRDGVFCLLEMQETQPLPGLGSIYLAG
jgi:hypothetical protein